MSNIDEKNGNDRILVLDGCDDHDDDRVAGAAIVEVANVRFARVGGAAAIG